MKYKVYPVYRSSGVEWLGDVPEHWEVKTIKWITPVLRGASPRPIEDPIYFDENGDYAWVRIADVTASNVYLEKTTQRLSEVGSNLSVKLEPGELFLSIAATVGIPCITNIKCCIHDGFVYFPRLKMDKKFMFYIFDCGEPYKGLGKFGTQLNLNTDTVGSIAVGYPPLSEQRAIAGFLDRETGKIDSLVSKKKRLVELLREKRVALISRAVTRGLDPSVKMKPSGVEWLGNVPEHWEIKRLKFILQKPLQYGANEAAELDDPELPRFVRITDVDEAGNLKEETFRSIPEEIAKPYLLDEGDILFARSGATVGKSFFYRKSWGRAAYAGYLIRARLMQHKAYPDFINFITKSFFYQQWINSILIQATIQNVSAEKYASFIIPLPPLYEQEEIAAFLDCETGKIDALIQKVETAVETLKEYRTALISAAVTGKIDVRETR